MSNDYLFWDTLNEAAFDHVATSSTRMIGIKNMNQIKPISRRKMILDSSVRGSITFLPIAVFSAAVHGGSSNKAMFHYQEDPKDGQMCSGCAAFTPPVASDETNGSCKIVGGTVKLRGWCIAFSPR